MVDGFLRRVSGCSVDPGGQASAEAASTLMVWACEGEVVRSAVYLAMIVVLQLGCKETSRALQPEPGTMTPEELAHSYLEGHTRSCSANSDCGTNLCDRSLSLWSVDDVGLCVPLFRATERWQRLVVAQSVAERMRDDAELAAAVWKGVTKRMGDRHEPEVTEGMMLLARCAGTEEARRFLLEVLRLGSSAERLHAGISLGRMGDASGMDQISEAAASSQPVMRVHAVWAAGGICTTESLGVIEMLSQDPHPMVRQASLLALAQCRSEEAALLRQRLQDQYRADPEEAEPGTAWLLSL